MFKTWGKSPPIVREYLEEAIKLDSSFYAAYAYLGFYWSAQCSWDAVGPCNFKENADKANELFEFAIKNAPYYGDSYVYMAGNKIFYEQDLKANELALKGYELNPSTSNKLVLLNIHLPALGDEPNRAYKLALEAMQESPLEPGSWAGKALSEYFVGKNDDAIKTLEQGLQKFKEGNLFGTAGRIFYPLERYESVVKVLEEYLAEFPGSRPARIIGYLAAAYYKIGKLSER